MITVTFTPSTTEHVAILAQAMHNIITCDPTKPQPKLAAIEEPTPPPALVEPEAPATVEAPAVKAKAPKKAAPEVSREELRACLAELSISGKREEVNELLSEYGAQNFTYLASRHFAAVLERAGQL